MLGTLSILLFNISTEHQRCAAWCIYDGGCCILELSHSNDSSNCSLNGRLWHVGGFVVTHFKIKNLCLPRWLIWSGSGRTGMVGAYTESAYACGRNGFGRRGRGGGIAGPCQFAVSPFPDALRQVRERSRRLSAGGRARPRSRGGIGITGHRAALPLSPGMTMPGLSSLRIRAGTLCH